jgi:hypothetical protein
MNLRNKPLEDWEEVVVRLRQDQKLTYHQIGRQLDVSGVRVRQIYQSAQARLKDFAEHGTGALSRLPTRVRRLVLDLNLGSRERTRSAIESGRLSWNESYASIHWDGKMLLYYGRRTWEVLLEWAGQKPFTGMQRTR